MTTGTADVVRFPSRAGARYLLRTGNNPEKRKGKHKMELIRKYAPNSDEMVKLKLACSELERLSTKGTTYTVEDIYFDVGLNWWYSAIVANRPDGRSWHAVCPRDYEAIILSKDIRKTCEDIVNDKYWYDP